MKVSVVLMEVRGCLTSDRGRWWVVLGEGETAAGQDVLFLQVSEFQDVDLTFDWKERRRVKDVKKKKTPLKLLLMFY